MVTRKLNPRQFLKLIFLLVLTIGLLIFFREFSPEDTIIMLQRNPSLAVVTSLSLNVLISLSGVLPSVFLTGANTHVFGMFWGGVVSWLGEILGALLSFLSYRYLLGDGARKLLQQYPSFGFLQKIDQNNGLRIILTARILPLVPSGLVNLLGAISPMSFPTFLLATALGKIPSLVVEAYIGYDLYLWQERWPRLLLMLTLAGLVYVVMGRFVNREP